MGEGAEMGRILDIDKLGVEIVFLAVNVVAQVVVRVKLGALHLLHQFKRIDGRVVRDRVFDDIAAVFEALEHVFKQVVKTILAMRMIIFLQRKQLLRCL